MSKYSSRLIYLDVLRGFALFGIVIVNIWYFADSHFGAELSHPAYQRGIDKGIRFLNALIFEAKFYLLFSFLFGYSFYLQSVSAERHGENFSIRILRRLGGLLLLGLLHSCLLYDAEILSLYACCGVILLLLRNKRPALLLGLSLLLLVFSASIWFLLAQFVELKPELHGDLRRLQAFRSSAWATLNFHVQNTPEMFGNLLILQAPSVIAMFLFGYLCARQDYLPSAMRGLVNLRAFFLPWLAFLAPPAFICAFFYALSTQFTSFHHAQVWAYGLQQLSAPLLSAVYVFALFYWMLKKPDSVWLQKMAYAGKFALSNYLMQSVLLGLIFTAYGLALIDQLAPWQIYLIAILIYVVQLQLSAWWGLRYRYGPAEYILRAITLWRLPEVRIKSSDLST